MNPKSALARQFKRLRPTRAPAQIVQRANRAIATDYDRLHESTGVGGDWANPAYGNYYATSVSIYSAIKLRADAMARAPLAVLRPAPAGAGPGPASALTRVPVDPGHPAQRLLDHVNPWHTRGDLWRATEINLCLWGSSFWALERDDSGQFEIWPLRSDRVRVLPEKHRHVKGFVYMGTNGPVPYTPDEIVWMRYYNPLEPFAGLSPLAPVRLSVDSGIDALRFNRNFFKNSAQPDFIFTTEDTLTDAELENFYHRWEDRYQGPAKAHRPAIASRMSMLELLTMRLKSSSGISPVNRLWLKSKFLNSEDRYPECPQPSFERLPNSAGMGPDNWLLLRSIWNSSEKLPNSSGIGPVNWLLLRSKNPSRGSRPNSGGIVPLN